MGAFDDLLPSNQQGGAQQSGFDDLIPSAKLDAIEPPNWIERQIAKITLPDAAEWGLNRARGFVMGAADPSVGAAQLVGNILPGQVGDRMNKAIAQKESEYEADRRGAGSDGFDFARLGGNIASPVNLAAARIPFAATTGGRVAQGAGMGSAGGAAQPVVEDNGRFWGEKAMQAGAGAALGGVAAPVAGRIGEVLMRRMADPAVVGARASLETDQIIKRALDDIGQSVNDLPPNAIADLRRQVVEAIKQGKRLDPAAMLRAADFKAVGVKPLLGQITRDPMQFAREQNLRGVANVGEPIAARLVEQNRALQSGVGGLRAGAVDDSFQAGSQISGAMKQADEMLRRHVSGLYAKARADAGKDLDVPLTGLAQDFADIVSRFGDKVPSGVVNQFKALGLDPMNPSNQRRIFTIEDADKLLKVINDNVTNDPAANRSLDMLRGAVKNSVLSVDATGGPFAPAVSAAAKRFKMQEVVPALKAAADGTIAPDDFIRRFVIGGKANDIKGMAKVLQSTDPEAYAQARAQIGAHLNRAAFGENITADKPFAAERFNKALREMGDSKLSAFFSQNEIAQLKTLGRVGAYIHQAPTGSAVNYSNTASATLNLANRIPGAPAAVSLAKTVKGAVDNSATIKRAVAAVPPITKDRTAGIGPDELRRLSDLLSIGAFGAGGLGGFAARQAKQIGIEGNANSHRGDLHG